MKNIFSPKSNLVWGMDKSQVKLNPANSVDVSTISTLSFLIFLPLSKHLCSLVYWPDQRWFFLLQSRSELIIIFNLLVRRIRLVFGNYYFTIEKLINKGFIFSILKKKPLLSVMSNIHNTTASSTVILFEVWSSRRTFQNRNKSTHKIIFKIVQILLRTSLLCVSLITP